MKAKLTSAIAAFLIIVLSGCSSPIDSSSANTTSPQVPDLGAELRRLAESPDVFISIYETNLGRLGYEELPELLESARTVLSNKETASELNEIRVNFIKSWDGTLTTCLNVYSEIQLAIQSEEWSDLAYVHHLSDAESSADSQKRVCSLVVTSEAEEYLDLQEPIPADISENLRSLKPDGWEDLLLESAELTNRDTEQEANADNDDEPLEPIANSETTSQANAKRMANQYIRLMPFSRKGLIDQLIFEGFSTSDAAYGVDSAGTNWRNQAVKMAANYLELMAFSKQGLIDQLVFEGFSQADATYGAEQNGL